MRCAIDHRSLYEGGVRGIGFVASGNPAAVGIHRVGYVQCTHKKHPHHLTYSYGVYTGVVLEPTLLTVMRCPHVSYE